MLRQEPNGERGISNLVDDDDICRRAEAQRGVDRAEVLLEYIIDAVQELNHKEGWSCEKILSQRSSLYTNERRVHQ